MNVVIFSSKRSTHHAFLESVLTGKKFYYQNNVRLVNGEFVPAKVVGEISFSDQLHVASFEMNYNVADVAKSRKLLDFFGMVSEDEEDDSLCKVIFLRDPLNTLASTLSVYKKLLGSDREKSLAWVEKNIKQWCSVYDYYCHNPNDFKFVYANKFWLDINYKSRVSDFFGGGVKRLTSVSKFGGGGSTFFDESSQVSPEGLDERYLQYSEDPLFLDFVKRYNVEMKKFFQDVCDKDKFEFVDACRF